MSHVIKRLKLKLPHEKDLPIVSGPDVFLATDYAQHAGIRPRTARERLQNLLAAGRVRRVRLSRNGRLYSGWEYLSNKKEVSA